MTSRLRRKHPITLRGRIMRTRMARERKSDVTDRTAAALQDVERDTTKEGLHRPVLLSPVTAVLTCLFVCCVVPGPGMAQVPPPAAPPPTAPEQQPSVTLPFPTPVIP